MENGSCDACDDPPEDPSQPKLVVRNVNGILMTKCICCNSERAYDIVVDETGKIHVEVYYDAMDTSRICKVDIKEGRAARGAVKMRR